MKKEAERAKRLPRFGSPLTPNSGAGGEYLTPGGPGADDDVFSVAAASTNNRKRGGYDTSGLFAGEFGEFVDASPEPSPGRPFLASNHPNNEIEALQQRLSHAQRQINTLKGTLQREKEMNRRRGSMGTPTGEEGEEDEEGLFEDMEVIGKAGASALRSRRATPFRSGGKTRGKPGRSSGLTLVQRLAMAPASPSSEFAFEEEVEDGEGSDLPPVPPIPIKFQQLDGQEDEEEVPAEESSNRTSVVSVEGMDPIFANVLKRANSNASMMYGGSPLRQSVLAASAGSKAGTMGRRRGAAYQEARPASLVGQPEALAAELGLGLGVSMEMEGERVLRDFGIQTDVETTPVPVPVLPTTTAQVETSELAVQTDVVVVVAKTDAAVQHEDIAPASVFVSTGIHTDPEPAAPIVDLVDVAMQTAAVEVSDEGTQTPVPPVPVPIVVEKSDMEVQTEVSSASVEVWPSIGYDEEERIRMRGSSELDRRTTITQRTLSLSRVAELSGETTITALGVASTRRFLAGREEEDDDDDGDVTETETGAETETDGEEYHDAPQSAVGMSTPSESLDDFHSVLTMTENEYSESEDEVSIKASTRMSIPPPSMRQAPTSGAPPESTRPSSYYATPPVSYESKEVSVVPIEEPKPEVREMSIQTDEWTPPPPLVPSLFRIGSGSQQFQFIPRSSSASGTSTPVAMPSPTPVPIPVPVPASPPATSLFRESTATFGVRGGRLSQTDRRQSIESAMSSIADDANNNASPTRSRVPSSGASGSLSPVPVDKTKPPMMVLPPPPKLPPPPSSMMPPPSFIPERKKPPPPPRPSSPPPAELIQRATTPTFGTVLSVGKSTYGRQHGASMPPSQQGLRQLPSTSSFRSAVNAAASYARSQQQQQQGGLNTLPSFQVDHNKGMEVLLVDVGGG